MVQGVVNGTITYYLGKTYQKKVSGSTVTEQKYYQAAGQMIAERTIVGGVDTLKWILTDHLGSTSLTANLDGSCNTELLYREAPCKGHRLWGNPLQQRHHAHRVPVYRSAAAG